VLERTGIEVMPSECRELFRAAGARVDDGANRVSLSRQMVEKALTLPPKAVRLCGRDPKHDMILGGTRVYMGTGGAAVKVLDLESGQARESTLQDVADFGRLADALANIHFYLRACVARDIPVDQLDINTYYAAAANTTKHVTVNAFSVQAVRDIVEMAGMILLGVAGGGGGGGGGTHPKKPPPTPTHPQTTTRLRDHATLCNSAPLFPSPTAGR
jgi:trimethylamine--corrinoid protein Co-methyltransferase